MGDNWHLRSEKELLIPDALRCCLPKALKDFKIDINIYYCTTELLQRCYTYNKIHLFENRTKQNKVLAL